MIRPILEKDNAIIATVIRAVLIEHDVPKVGTAYADVALDKMFETYNVNRSRYFVVEENGTIWGGAGIAPLANENDSICELQKMYFLPEARGKGFGFEMMQSCLRFAIEAGFKQCYIETMPNMHDAQKLYQKAGFIYIDQPLGNTGHNACPVWMIKNL
uniref:GNAT family N-acetyltransferase n=1 Tax=Flavobacterium sp. TaxID=239 RepID=UPI00404B44D5